MKVDFLACLPQDKQILVRRQIERENIEVERIYALNDRWLGETVLRLVRTVRSLVPEYQRRSQFNEWNTQLVLWDLAPELAKRVGCRVQEGEALNLEVRCAKGDHLRETAGGALMNIARGDLLKFRDIGKEICPIRLFCRELGNGAPLALLLDRVAAPHLSSKDACASVIRQVSLARGHGPLVGWSPQLQTEPVRLPR